MPREKGNLIDCLRKARHHVEPNTAELLFYGRATLEQWKYRFGLVNEEITTVLEKLNKIQEIAVQHGYQDITAVFKEEVEYGHQF